MAASFSLRQGYQALVEAGRLQPDAAQTEALAQLEVFEAFLAGYQPGGAGFWARLRGHVPAKLPARGFYLYGEVGRGKSLLMDLFFERVQVARKRRVHFHQFMLEVHDRLHRARKQGLAAEGALPHLARQLARETWLLCFDEFHVNNIADAMILGRLFEALLAAGVVIFVTSNSAPEELYKGGLQRERFLPFLDLLKQAMIVHQLAGPVDHRYEGRFGLAHYFTPLGKEASTKLGEVFVTLTEGAVPEVLKLPVQGRTVTVPWAAKGVALFWFDELCGKPLGAADFLALAECFHTILLDGVPLIAAERRNEAARFITLIDALYEARTQLYMAAALPPELLCVSGEQAVAFQRTASRLVEMQTESYQRLAHLG